MGMVSRILMRRLVNPTVGLLLRSPLHRLLSGGLMLISVTGRRSGRTYTTPVQYVRANEDLYVITRRGRGWWRNVGRETPVRLRLAGRTLDATASIVPGEEMAGVERAVAGSSLSRVVGRPDAVAVRVRVTPVTA